MVQVQDLRRVDPFNTLLKTDDYDETILPSSGLITTSSRKINRQLVTSVALDSIISVGVLVYLLTMKECLTPDFLHFIMCLGEDACHTLWAFGLWFTFKTFYVKPRESSSLPESFRVTIVYAQGIIGLILASDLRVKTFIEFTACSAVLIARACFGKHLNLSLAFFMGIYFS